MVNAYTAHANLTGAASTTRIRSAARRRYTAAILAKRSNRARGIRKSIAANIFLAAARDTPKSIGAITLRGIVATRCLHTDARIASQIGTTTSQGISRAAWRDGAFTASTNKPGGTSTAGKLSRAIGYKTFTHITALRTTQARITASRSQSAAAILVLNRTRRRDALVQREVANLWCAISSWVFSRSTPCSRALSKPTSFAFNRAGSIGIKRTARCKLTGPRNAILIDRACAIRLSF